MSTKHSQQTRVAHYRKNSAETDVYIGRGNNQADMTDVDIGERGWLGNPYPESEYGRERCIELFRNAFEQRLINDEEFQQAVRELHGKTLGCWCQGLHDDSPACHGEVIAEWVARLNH